MKQVDFSDDHTFRNILATALPMLVAQILNLLYNIVDRIYIARLPKIGTAALGGVGLCFPVIILITAFTNMYGSGGTPLFAIARGRGDRKEAGMIQNTSFFLLVATGIVLIAVGEGIARPLLILFGASGTSLIYALPYLRIYLLGTLFSMIATGMNPFINAQGYSQTGMLTVVIGAGANIILDPIFMFGFGWGVEGAALATILSQGLSSLFVLQFIRKKAEYRVRLLSRSEISESGPRVRKIIGLGLASFIMQVTNSLVSISCNQVLADIGGDVYVSIMTIVNSARQMLETPILAITEGASPILSYNYGAERPKRLWKAGKIMTFMAFGYGIVVWLLIRTFPEQVISIFSSDKTILKDAVPAFHIYFAAFLCMIFQYIGQTVFKSLGKKKHAIFFSLLRKGIIVIPMTYILPYVFHLGTDGVFMAEPISNAVGGTACFVTMLVTMIPELRKMEKEGHTL
jgi:putative MATE family efflux protein